MPRINKCIELLEQGQPIYTTRETKLTYETGLKHAQTWADVIRVEFEHAAFDTAGMGEFMRGLRDGGPTPSGHLTPAVVCSLPSACISVEEVAYNAWQARHLLATGVHGLLQIHARRPDAARAFVATARYPMHTVGLDHGIPEGLRGSGGQSQAAAIWGLSEAEYVMRAEPWPLNPDGELMLGLKIEDRHCLPAAGETAVTPGTSFAEWGPGDMSMSLGDPAGHDPPYKPEMMAAMNTVRAACHKAGIAFHSGWADPSMSVEDQTKYLIAELGVKSVEAPDREYADIGRSLTGRTMPV